MRGRPVALLVCVFACANAKGDDGGDDGPPDAGGPVASDCPPGQYAVDIAPDGLVMCAAISVPAQAAIDESCSVYLGWRDACDGCPTDPAKWGRTGTNACANGVGTGNTCTTPDLGDGPVQLFGLDFEGDVDGNDKIYGSLHCVPIEPTGGLAPCPPGEAINGKLGSSFTCGKVGVAAVEYVRGSCSLYLGWQDNCDGCTNPPTKFGHAGDGGCANDAGGDNTCTGAMLDGQSVNLFGLNPDGDVDGNDKLHAGLACVSPAADTSTQMVACPPNQFVVGTLADGSFRCASPAPEIAQQVSDRCSVFFGWSDGCDGCTNPPQKFGKTGVAACTNLVGADSTCGKLPVGEGTIELFGLSPDGDVDGNDALYVGFRCK